MFRWTVLPAIAGLITLVGISTGRADALDDAVALINRHLSQLTPVSISIQRAQAQPMPGRVILDALMLSDGRNSFTVPGPIVVGEVKPGPVKVQGELEIQPGSFHIKELFLSRFVHSDSRSSLSIDAIGLSDVIVPPVGTIDPFLLAQLAGTVTTGQVKAEHRGEQVLVLDSLAAAIRFRPERGSTKPVSMTVAGNVNGFVLTREMIKELELRDLLGPMEPFLRDRKVNIGLPLTWDVESGTLSLSGARLDVPGYASVSGLVEVKGLTRELVDEAVEQANITLGLAPAPNPPQPAQAFLMRAMASLGVSVASVELTNETLVQILLAQLAMDAKMSPDELKTEIVGEIERGLSATGMPKFAAQATAAVSSFLDKPGTLKLAARPATTALFLQIAAFAAFPEQLVDFLGVSVEALPPA